MPRKIYVPAAILQAIFSGASGGPESVTTTINADGTVSIVYALSGVTNTVTFNPDGSITESFSAPVARTKTTTFAGSAIVETVA